MLWKVITNHWFSRSTKTVIKTLNLSKMPFYAVAKGRTAGIYMTWPDCESQVKGFPGARYKKFDNIVAAQDFVTTEGGNKSSQKAKPLANRSSFGSSKSNLKRNFSTSANDKNDNSHIPKKKSKSKRKTSESNESEDTDDSDDLNTILIKQMDDIEKRLKGFEKGVDKIMKKSSKTDRKSILIEPQTVGSSNLNEDNFKTDEDDYVQVYTDGACSSNGRSGAKAGLGVYWGEGHPLNISEPVSGRATNNCGEIQAATRAITMAINHGVKKLAINTDSKFLINSVTKWMPGWKRKGWKLQSGEPVKNEIDFKELDSLQNKIKIKWNYVEAHRGIHGNEMADQLAKAGAAMYNK
ncbi:ribonuclease H1 [Vanessa atalanta]|uniref:ribonuclease H1 n=1 Tax=Vanessa atalanta TaxID=42275 RepID=UPI001FCD84CA|nr:ribonuclease H1 [Vanessa atalanta]